MQSRAWTLALAVSGAAALAACGATNVNQPNYDKVKHAWEAEHGGGHGDHGEGEDGHDDDKKEHGDKDDGHGDAGEAGHGDADGDPAPAGVDVAAGKKVYGTYCVSCHGPDGKGMNGLAANLAEDETRLAKPTDQLVKSIREGYSGKVGVMPPWGAVVSDTDARNVVAYLRAEYGGE